MVVTLWACQGLLAAVFLLSGVLKATWSRDRLIASGQTGIAPYPMPVVRFTAVCELFAVAGLILPRLTGIAPVLTPLAAVGLCVVMVGAAVAHYTLREPYAIAANAVLFGIAAFVAIGTFAN